METELTFGSYVKAKRVEKQITLRKMSELIGISPNHLCNIENDNRSAPAKEVLNKMIELFRLGKNEIELFLDLAAETKNYNAVADDLPKYINENDIVRVALRTAKDVSATDKEWQDFIERLRSR